MIKRRFNTEDFDNDVIISKNDLKGFMIAFIKDEVKERLTKEMEEYYRNKFSQYYDEG